MTDRRDFLRSALAVAGAGGLASLLPARQGLARSLDRAAAASPAAIRGEYLLDPAVVYLNHASIGTVPRAVHRARQALLDACESNPWLHIFGGVWDDALESTRRGAARLIGCGADELAFTHNTTEGFNALAQGLPLGPGDEVLFSTLNHDGASICWFHHGARRGYRARRFEFPQRDAPRLTVAEILDLYDRQISRATRVLVLPHIDNTVGLRHPVRELTELARGRGVEYVAVDGAQSVGMIPVDVTALGVDFYAGSPHKWVQSPKGVGLLYVRKAVQDAVSPMWVTWGQERWAGSVRVFEDYGTRNLPEVVALGDAVAFQDRLGQAAKERRYRELFERMRDRTLAEPGLVWHSPTEWPLGASLAAIEVRGVRSGELFQRLFHQAGGGFVFRAFEGETMNHARISPNVFTTDEELEALFEAMTAP